MISLLAAHLLPDLEQAGPGAEDEAGGFDLLPTAPISAEVHIARPPRCRVVRLGPTGLWLIADGRADFQPGMSAPMSLHLGMERVGPLQGVVAEVRHEHPAEPPRVRLSFPEISCTQARDVLALVDRLAGHRALHSVEQRVAVTEDVRASERLTSIARALVRHGCDGFVRGADGRFAAVRGVSFEESSDLPLRWALDGPAPAPPLHFAVAGLMSLFEFEVAGAAVGGGELAVAVPARILRRRRREWRRATGHAPIPIAFRHPQWPEHVVRGELHDVSRGGLGVQATPVHDLLYPGLGIPAFQVADGELAGVTLQGHVRHVRMGSGAAAVTCGLSVQIAEEAARERWNDEVERLLHPNTRSAGAWSGALWDLFRDAGYFDLSRKSQAHFNHLRRHHEHTLRRLEACPEIAVQVTWPDAVGVAGASTAVRAYTGTWFGFHMARRKGEVQGRQLLRDVHLHIYEHAQALGDLRWMLSYIQANADWPRLAHVGFAREHLATGEGCVVGFHARQGACYQPAWPLPGGCEVAAPSADEIDALLAFVERERPFAYRDAFDLVPERVQMDALCQRWRAGGLSRARVLRVARRRGVPLAVGIFEMASEGIHLYGLLDVVRLYPLVAGGEAGFPALIEAARGWFREHHKESFVYLEEYPCPDLGGANLTDLGRADTVLYATRLLPDAMEYVWEKTSGREA